MVSHAFADLLWHCVLADLAHRDIAPLAGRIRGAAVAVLDDFVHVVPEGLGPALGVVSAAGGLGEVALAFDIGVLQGRGPGADLAGAGFGEGFPLRDFRLEIGVIWLAVCSLGPKLR